MKIDIHRECPITQTPRVVQVSGMFDVRMAEKSRVVISGDLPIEEREWNVGLIVGPSGSGKSTVAQEIFGDNLITGFDWPTDRSILDGFPEQVGIKTVTGLLNSVGFGSTPNWLRPFRVLSNGEQFRATVARALAEKPDLVVIDEFTSVVDRQVAKVASHCVQKAVRRSKRRLIAVACHYDIIEWLQPDWVYEPHLGAFEWRSLQRRPEISVELRAVGRDVWDRFSKYHYLTADLNPGSLCVGAFIAGQCVGFCGISKFPHPLVRNIFNESRTVVLPDYQGLGLSRAMTEWIGQHLWERGWRFHSVTTHPAIVAQKAASARWKLHRHGVMGANKSDNRGIGFTKHARQFTARRIAANFSYIAPAGTVAPPSPQRIGPLFEGSAQLAEEWRATRR
jgi:ABC-type lipoprotein export system ATPase subunit/GNAT superfamily N-acetyltransferase